MFSSSRRSARRARHHEAAGFHQVGVVGEIERERGVLLDQQHAHLLVLVERAQDAEQLLARSAARARTRARRAASGAGAASGRARPPASAARRPRACRPAGGGAPSGAGNSRRRARCRRRSPARSRRVMAPSCEVLLDRLARERAAALRHMRDAEPHDVFGRAAGDRLALEADLAARAAPCRRARAASWSCRRRSRRAAS